MLYYQYLRKKTFCKKREGANSPIPNCYYMLAIQRQNRKFFQTLKVSTTIWECDINFNTGTGCRLFIVFYQFGDQS